MVGLQRFSALVLFLLLPFLVRRARAQCADEGSCTVECYPVHWERNLCQFYTEISTWRSTVERYGLSLPATPTRDTSLSGDQQWEQAREYWYTVLEVWKEGAVATGVLDEGSADGSGEATPTEQSQAVWLEQLTSWEEQYATWTAHAREQDAGTLPESNSGEILAGVIPDEETSSVHSNIRSWESLLMDWGTTHTVYNSTY